MYSQIRIVYKVPIPVPQHRKNHRLLTIHFLFIIGSMAISYSFPAPIPIRRSAANRLLVMRAHNQISVNGNPLQIRSFSKNKVFEDLSAGIVCYRDENGDITCEGFDEGPRFHRQLSRFTCNSRDIEIVELLQRCWDGIK